jgi:hypothetical protein
MKDEPMRMDALLTRKVSISDDEKQTAANMTPSVDIQEDRMRTDGDMIKKESMLEE